MTYGHLQADCLYTGISSGPNARCRVWEAFTFLYFIYRQPCFGTRTYCEWACFADLALNKAASQSGTYSDFVATRAVDGLRSTSSCSGNMIHPWWAVDLGDTYSVGHVTVTNDENKNHRNYRRICFTN